MAKKILIVEDEEDARFLIKESLEDQGYEVLEAEDGEIGLRKVEEEKPDLIILDIMLPKIDGYTFNLKLKENPATAGLPVIISTARAQMKELFLLNEKARVSAYLEKPFPLQSLVDKIKEILENKR